MTCDGNTIMILQNTKDCDAINNIDNTIERLYRDDRVYKKKVY